MMCVLAVSGETDFAYFLFDHEARKTWVRY